MGYEGEEIPIPLGAMGLHTDGPQSELPAQAAIVANNISFWQGVLSKSPGSSVYNPTGLPKPIVAAIDWWPDAAHQRLIAYTSDGHLYRDTGDGTFSSNVALQINETQAITFSNLVSSGSVVWKWNGNAASSSNTGGTDTAAQVQTKLRTISGLSSVVVNGDWTVNGFTVFMPNTTTSQPLITTNSSSLVDAASASVTVNVSHIQAGLAQTANAAVNSCFVAGGAEVQGNPRRLFLFSPANGALMITGDNTMQSVGFGFTGVTRPAADWASSVPVWGVIYNNRLVVLMGHNIYISKLGDHTDFSTTAANGTGAAVFPIFPGEGDGLISAIVFKGALLLFKHPFGVYLFTWNGGDLTVPSNLSITKFSDAFATASPHGTLLVPNDLYGGSLAGSVFSLQATNAYGSLEAGDLLNQAAVRNYMRNQLDPSGINNMTSAFYGDKSVAMFTGVDQPTNSQDRIIMYDIGGSAPRISLETKDQPNCLFMRRDANFIPRPYYGAADGFIYAMDQSARNVNGKAYTGEFQTPFIDFSFADPKLSDKVKLFDFLSVTFQSVGNWSFYVDVYIDGVFTQTLSYLMNAGFILDQSTLDQTPLAGNINKTVRKRLVSCAGRAISFRIYNGVLNQYFTVERLIVSFRLSGEQNKSSKG